MSKATGYGILGVVGVVFILGASIFLGLFPGIIEKKIKEELPLVNGSDTYNRWKEIKVPVYMKFHIFNLTNPDDYHNLTGIQLKERGPYVFEEKRIKENIKYFKGEKGENLVTYRERKIYEFKQNLSVGKLNDTVIFINLPTLGIIFNRPIPFARYVFESVFKNLSENEKSLFTKRTVGELLFEGFNMTLFKKLKSLKPDLDESFSIFDGTNELEEPWTIHTGVDNMDEYGEVVQFDNIRNLSNNDHSLIWKYHDENATTCNALKGTDGTMFPPSVSKADRLYAFEPQLCRTVYFNFGEETTVRDINTYRFWVPKEYFKSPNNNKENSCYCPQKNVTECSTDGILDISNCIRKSQGAPVIMSSPYFNHGDPILRKSINLKTDKDINDQNYGTFLDIEPMTGTVLRACRRIQISVEINHYENIPELKQTEPGRNYVVPVLWLEETAEADEKQADEFKSMITNKVKLGNGISIAVIVIGALITITAIVLYVRHRKSSNKSRGNGEITDYNQNHKRS